MRRLITCWKLVTILTGDVVNKSLINWKQFAAADILTDIHTSVADTIRQWKNFDDTFSRFATVSGRNRQTHILRQHIPRAMFKANDTKRLKRLRWSQQTASGLELWGLGGLTPSSCLQTLIFEWKSVTNFNPWAKFHTFWQLTPPVLLGQFQHWTASYMSAQFSNHRVSY